MPTPLQEGFFDRANGHQGLFAEGLILTFGLSVLFQAAVLVRSVDDCLELALVQVRNFQLADDRENIVFTILLTLLDIRSAAGQLDRLDPLGIEDGNFLVGARDIVVQPRIGLGIGFPLTSAAGSSTVKIFTDAVFLYADLPLVERFAPCGGIGSLACHKNFSSFGSGAS